VKYLSVIDITFYFEQMVSLEKFYFGPFGFVLDLPSIPMMCTKLGSRFIPEC
jgi:hypothetical protein